MKKVILILALMTVFATSIAFAHSGRTDSTGCHTDHRTGIRHCH